MQLQMPRAIEDAAGGGPSNIAAKRARRSGGLAVDNPVADDAVCVGCGKGDDADAIYMCDLCNAGYHIACTKPPMAQPPSTTLWFCHNCREPAMDKVRADVWMCGILRHLLHYHCKIEYW